MIKVINKQVFEITVQGMIITPELISGLLRDYFISTISRSEFIEVKELVVDEEKR